MQAFFETVTDKINAAIAWLRKTLAPAGQVMTRIFDGLMVVWKFLVRLRKIFLAVPVALAALYLARLNMERLPEQVGWDLQIDESFNGYFELMISREWACGIPMLITLVCIVLMCCSKRVLTPWVVSVISLMLPIFLWLTNVFPA